jgi:subtilisin family serine protease
MARITINGVSLDPLAERPLRAFAAAPAPDASGSDYILIQTREPLSPAQLGELEGLGVKVLEFVPEDTYLASFKPTDLAAVRALPFVVWADVYSREFKVGPDLLPPTARVAGVRAPSRKLRQVDVVMHDDVDPDSQDLREQIAASANVDPGDVQAGRRKVRLTVEEGALSQLSALDAVHHIEPVPERQLFNNVARGIVRADVVINGTSFEGDGQIVAVADTGLDRGSTTDVHPAFTGRVKKLYALGRPSPARADDPHGHGTHVAGSVLGDGQSASMGGRIQGTAPKAQLVLQSTIDANGGLGGLPNDLHDLFEPPYEDDGARVHSNSWGATTPGLPYDSSAREIDDTVWQHPDLVIVFAAGNDGADGDDDGIADRSSIGSQSAAKNCITVGACESERPEFSHTYGEYWPNDFPAEPLHSDLQANDADGMVAFSSRGPTKEQRIKPDVVAPGTCILSTRSRRANVTDDFGQSSDPAFFFDSGTSMATPLVSGCVAVLREALIKNGTPNPSAALIKALLIQGAVPLPGQYTPSEAGGSPNTSSGWGRVDLAGSVLLPTPQSGFGEAGPLEQGQESTFEITVPEPARLKVTLVWTDPPGAALQNDLDLIVKTCGEERHGNAGATTSFDRTNNVEQVVWDPVPAGEISVVVRAFRITRFPQPFAYAWRLVPPGDQA